MSTGKIVEVRKDVFAPDVTVKDPQTGKSVNVKGRLIEAGTQYIHVALDGTLSWIVANLHDVKIPREQQVLGLSVKFDTVDKVNDGRLRAINVVAA